MMLRHQRDSQIAEEGRHLHRRNFNERLGQDGRWFLAAGISYVFLGLIAISWPVNSSVGLAFVLGILFIVGSILNLIHSIRLRREAGTSMHLFQMIATLAAGILMLRYPQSGILGITVAMAFYFFISGAAKGVLAFAMRPYKGWGSALVSSVVSLVLGVYIVATFPVSALWIPGLLLGVDFIIYGTSLIGFASELRKRRHEVKKVAEPVDRQRAA